MFNTTSSKSLQTLLTHFIVIGQGLFIAPFLIKSSGEELLGLYSLIMLICICLYSVSSFGIGTLYKRYLPSTKLIIEKSNLFFPQFFFQIFSCLLIGLVSTLIFSNFFFSSYLIETKFNIFLIIFYLFSYVLYSQVLDYYRYSNEITIFNFVTILQPLSLIFFIIIIFYINKSININTLILLHSISFLIYGLIFILFIIKNLKLKFIFPKKEFILKDIKIGLPIIIATLVVVLVEGGDRFIISFFLDFKKLGSYIPAYMIGSIILIIPKVLSIVIFPLIAQRVDEKKTKEAYNLIDRSYRIYLYLSIPFFFGSIPTSYYILKFFANEYVSSAAWEVVPVIAFSSIFYGLLMIDANIFFIRLKTNIILYLNIFIVFSNFILNTVLLLIFKDIFFAALATLFSYFAGYIIQLFLIKNDNLKFKFNLIWIVKVILSSIIMVSMVYLMEHLFNFNNILEIIFVIILSIIIYFLILIISKDIREEMLYYFNSFFRLKF